MEQQLIDWLVARLGGDPRLDVPNGDDAAVLRPPAGRRTVFCTDMLCEGVHFPRAPDYDPRAVGHKAIAVNLSDVAAMAGCPLRPHQSRTLPSPNPSRGSHLSPSHLSPSRAALRALREGRRVAVAAPCVTPCAQLPEVARLSYLMERNSG